MKQKTNKQFLFYILFFLLALIAMQGCSIKYSFSGASIPLDAKTFSVPYIKNNASLVEPTLSQTITDALRNKLTNQTNLSQIDRNGDLNYECFITGYVPSQPGAISGETAKLNRMTITVSVKYTNKIENSQSFERSFSQYIEYDSSLDLMSIQGGLINSVVELLVEDIFNQSVVNW